MKTILIAHRDAAFAAQLESQLCRGGYKVISCVGPGAQVERSIRCNTGYRPLADGVDLMIYDPLLTAVNAHGDRYNVAIDSALAHPDIPMLLAWSPAEVPDFGTLRGIRNLAPHVHAAAHAPLGGLDQPRWVVLRGHWEVGVFPPIPMHPNFRGSVYSHCRL